ncbi:MAG: HAMP domain-containing histidine kinase [Acholeplasmatales bacterium]|nr:HAMP domain-containing histidine kinase [Acholeplasmatales bacterium]
MKKFSISIQLLILVFSLLLLTSAIFILLTYAALYSSAEQQVYNRLEAATSMTPFEINESNEDRFDMKIYFVNKKMGVTSYERIGDYLTEEEFQTLYNDVLVEQINGSKNDWRRDDSVVGRYTTSSGESIYYYLRIQMNSDFTFAFTNTDFVNTSIQSTFFMIFASFLGILFLAVAVIYVWSTSITKRLKRIQNHIIDLPKNKYEKAYSDYSLDEIGELSRSVENMRIEIGNYEKTKQDMLQNLSHDFKTPIAVIKSYAEAYQDGMVGPEALNVIIEQSELLKKKVNRLLQYNSLEYLTKDKPFEDINMTELVRTCVQNYKFQTDISFDLDLEENICFSGYLENWTTVVDNIIDNAKRYAKSVIKIVLRENRLRIYNDGDPIDEQFINSVFKPYEKGSKGQFGLGMSIVKKTVDFFGMYMSVKNEEYGGVSFIIEKK